MNMLLYINFDVYWYGNCSKFSATINHTSMKKAIEAINKSQKEIENTIFEMKNTVEGIKSRLDEAEDWNSKLEDKVEKKTPRQNTQETPRKNVSE